MKPAVEVRGAGLAPTSFAQFFLIELHEGRGSEGIV